VDKRQHNLSSARVSCEDGMALVERDCRIESMPAIRFEILGVRICSQRYRFRIALSERVAITQALHNL
ncbi:hypothetical protein SeLEV6574_g06249, partial [Synchytrium endobioticum]